MNTNLTTDPISYDGWTREWSIKYNVNYWYNAKTDTSVWEDPIWNQIIGKNSRKVWKNKITNELSLNDPWVPVPKSPAMSSPPLVTRALGTPPSLGIPPPSGTPPPIVKWGDNIYKRDNVSDEIVVSEHELEDEWKLKPEQSEYQVPIHIQPDVQPMQREPLILLRRDNEIPVVPQPTRDANKKIDPKKQLEFIVSHYLRHKSQFRNIELEGRFGTRGKSITRIQFNNVITKLLSLGFRKKKEEYRLSANIQYVNKQTGEITYSSIRPEIKFLDIIQQFCKEDDLDSIVTNNPRKVTFIQKTPYFKLGETESVKTDDAIFEDFNFSVSCKNEIMHKKDWAPVVDIIQNWASKKKTFRHMNRITYEHPDIPYIKFELSIVRSTSTPTYKISDSNIFSSPERYEIEFEIVNDAAGNITSQELIALIHKMSTHVLCGLQGSNYPISMSMQNNVLQSYMKILYPDDEFTRAYPNNFIGPSPCTLQRINIGLDENTNEPNIRENYCVTDKADGERYLMLIDHDGKIYLINQGMNVIFTGALTKNEKLFNTIIDGELIIHDKEKNFINLFAAFDIYFIKNTKVRHFPLMKTDMMQEVPSVITEEKAARDKKALYRYDLLQEAIHTLKPVSVIKDKPSPMRFTVKTFYVPSNGRTIFDYCRTILDTQNTMEYLSDGLIFTPTLFGVGSNQPNKDGPFKTKTWNLLLKWKPSSLNTIDFLVETLKDPSGQDTVSSIFKDGDLQIHQFKTLVLKCGFNENTDGYINPCLDIINGVKYDTEKEDRGKYKPMQFYPSKPSNNKAGLCNIIVQSDMNNEFKMFTKNEENHDGEVFEDDMIVEFRFDKNKYDAENVLSWIPIRIRYDKTEEYRKGKLENQFRGPNSYRTANDNWYSIHYPVTEEMIKTGEITGENIDSESSEDVYYKNGNRNTATQGLRDFHNLFVKNLLITSVSHPGNTLIDYACGKGGDLPKWIDARLSFVFGIDISSDNLENRLNGSCARYLNYRKKYSNMPDALFVTGDSSKNIRDGTALGNELSKKITSAVFGQGERNEDYLGRGVYKHFGDGMDGFNISSCQFALHYFFKTPETFHNFIRNLAECTRINGYFIGTCYDGQSVFKKLKRYNTGEGIEYYKNRVKICQIVKNYSDDYEVLEEDESCIGKEILVWQDSINQMIPEYLVNFNYLVRIMEDYGFVLQQPNSNLRSSDLFQQLFYKMKHEAESNKHKKEVEFKTALSMSDVEKDVSFLNRYFIFQKIREVDAAKIARQFIERIQQPTEEQHTPTLDVRPLQNSIVLKADTVKTARKPKSKEASEETEVEQLQVETTQITREPPAVVEVPVEPKKRGRPTKKIIDVQIINPPVKQTKTKKNVTVAPAVVAVAQAPAPALAQPAAVEFFKIGIPTKKNVWSVNETTEFIVEIDGVISELIMTENLTKEIVIAALEKKLKFKLNAPLKNVVSERGRAFGYTW
jgi:hypothetical protein